MLARKLIGFTIFTLSALALLIGLGAWQLQRLQWKQGLIAAIETQTKAEPVSLDEALARAAKKEDVDYLRIRVKGRFDHAHEFYLYALSNDGEPGWHVITPFNTDTAELVLVDRGFVPNRLRDPATRAAGQLEGIVEVTGLARPPEAQGMVLPDNDPEHNRWYYRNLDEMIFRLFPTATMPPQPFLIEAERSDVPGGWPLGGQTRLDLPNNHLQYALTWFLLALGILVVYAVYVAGVLRGRPR